MKQKSYVGDTLFPYRRTNNRKCEKTRTAAGEINLEQKHSVMTYKGGTRPDLANLIFLLRKDFAHFIKKSDFFMKLSLELLKREMDADKYVINR